MKRTLALLALLLAHLPTLCAADAATKPDIILFVADDHPQNLAGLAACSQTF